MRTKRLLRSVTSAAMAICAACLIAGPVLGAEPICEDLIDDEVGNFSLPSTHDRLANYQRDYYGKHHLILTFFPAAFTPV